MILRRIAEHLRAQNWTAVFLEFLIVAAGVFLGIQLGNWNEARFEARQERALVMRLIEDARQSGIGLASAMEFTQEKAATARWAHVILLDGDLPPADEARFREAVVSFGPWQGDRFVSATVDQAIADGSIALIRSVALRGHIAQHRENMEGRAISHQNLGTMNLQHLMAVRERLDIRISDEGQTVLTSKQDMLADEQLRRTIGQFAFVYDQMAGLSEDSIDMNAAYQDRLEAYARERRWID